MAGISKIFTKCGNLFRRSGQQGTKILTECRGGFDRIDGMQNILVRKFGKGSKAITCYTQTLNGKTQTIVVKHKGSRDEREVMKRIKQISTYNVGNKVVKAKYVDLKTTPPYWEKGSGSRICKLTENVYKNGEKGLKHIGGRETKFVANEKSEELILYNAEPWEKRAIIARNKELAQQVAKHPWLKTESLTYVKDGDNIRKTLKNFIDWDSTPRLNGRICSLEKNGKVLDKLSVKMTCAGLPVPRESALSAADMSVSLKRLREFYAQQNPGKQYIEPKFGYEALA